MGIILGPAAIYRGVPLVEKQLPQRPHPPAGGGDQGSSYPFGVLEVTYGVWALSHRKEGEGETSPTSLLPGPTNA